LAKVPSFYEFRQRAEAVFESIPDDYRGGVDGLIVERQAVPHPTLPDIYTLGECATGEIDPEGEAEVHLRSQVILYYGSFVRLSRLDDEWDWDGEIWETITHEIRHHRETAAGEDALEDVDYAADQNFARLDGQPFDPFFHRSGDPVAAGTWEVEGELFVEVTVDAEAFAAMAELRVRADGREVAVDRPEPLGDVHFVDVEGTPRGMLALTIVLVRRRGAWESFRAWLARRRPVVHQSTATARVGPPEG
jgi:hypothetical protein